VSSIAKLNESGSNVGFILAWLGRRPHRAADEVEPQAALIGVELLV